MSAQVQGTADDTPAVPERFGPATTADELIEVEVGAESELAQAPALDAQARELAQVDDELLQRRQGFDDELLQRHRTLDELVAISDRYTAIVETKSWEQARPLRTPFALDGKLQA